MVPNSVLFIWIVGCLAAVMLWAFNFRRSGQVVFAILLGGVACWCTYLGLRIEETIGGLTFVTAIVVMPFVLILGMFAQGANSKSRDK